MSWLTKLFKKPIVTVDFETQGIEAYPDYPPKPVGVALRWADGSTKYYAWDHPMGNNCTRAQAQQKLKQIWFNNTPLFHNASFDCEVAYKWCELPFPETYHDTLFLAFLYDPRAVSLSLKPMADTYLDMPPEEQDSLNAWIDDHIFKPQKMKATKNNPYGKYIADAPGDLVEPYAIGDVERTFRLFEYFAENLYDCEEAYRRELKVMPIFNRMTRDGLNIAYKRLAKDVKAWEKEQEEIQQGIFKRLGGEFNLNSGAQLADAMERKNLVKEWIQTEKGGRSTSKDNLSKVCTDKALVTELARYSDLQKIISTYGRPWVDLAGRTGGKIHPSFNQVRSPDERTGGMRGGTRTGRPSSTNPNFLNIPPIMRDYIVPAKGNVLLNRDYSQQELRILAHFEEGPLYQQYLEDPETDVHDYVNRQISSLTGVELDRKPVKILDFLMVYGGGVKALIMNMEKYGLDCDEDMARELMGLHRKALPAVQQLNNTIQRAARKGQPILTWGGREYFAESPKVINGKRRTFEYKQLNYLIQGSAADCTKEAMIRVDEACKGNIILQVYDEIMLETHKEYSKSDMKLMREAMESVEFDVPMLTEGKRSGRSWAKCVDCE